MIFKIIIVLFTSLLIGCDQDDFYEDTYVNGCSRIPIIESYVLQSCNDGKYWFIDIKTKGYGSKQIGEIQKIGRLDSVFVLYAYDEYKSSPFVSYPFWYISLLNKNQVYVFNKQEEYERFVDSLGYGDLKLYDANQLYSQFKTTGELPWHKKQ